MSSLTDSQKRDNSTCTQSQTDFVKQSPQLSQHGDSTFFRHLDMNIASYLQYGHSRVCFPYSEAVFVVCEDENNPLHILKANMTSSNFCRKQPARSRGYWNGKGQSSKGSFFFMFSVEITQHVIILKCLHVHFERIIRGSSILQHRCRPYV